MDTAAAQLTNTVSAIEQELDDAEALTGVASVGGGESTTVEKSQCPGFVCIPFSRIGCASRNRA